MPRLLLVDGHSNLYRAFYAIRTPLTAPDGTPTGAAYGFLRMQHKLLRDLAPTHVAVAFDAGGETFRSRLDDRYKAQRPPMPDPLRVQVPLTIEALRLLGVEVLQEDDVEADDVLGTLAVRAAAAGFEVVIASADKDLMQLVRDPAITMWHTRLERRLDEGGVAETFGVPPAQVGEVLSLMGDASDNIPGCPGIGEKGARELIRTWGSVESVYDALAVGPPRRDELADFYRRVGFTSLLAELGARPSPPPPVAVAVPTREASPADAAALLARAGGGVVLDGDTLAVAAGGEVAVARGDAAELARALAPRLGPGVWCHDAKALLARLRDAGAAPVGVADDALLAGYLLAPGENVDLRALCGRHGVSGAALAEPAGRAAALAELAGVLDERLAAEGLTAVYRDIELPLVPVLEAMERRGIALDSSVLADLSRRLEGSLAELERDIHAEAGGPFNLNSPAQLAEVLFERRGLPVLRKTAKTKAPSTDAEVLAELAARGHRLPALLLDYREQSKLKSTYVDALPRQVAADGRVHTRYNQAVAATGRLSSSDPNLQNIPIRTALGREVRRAFVAADGRLLIGADYSQIELRVLAHLSEDPALERAFATGADIHQATAALVFGVAPELVSSEQRRAAKTINFGLIYGMGAFALGRDLGVSAAEAQRFIDAYFAGMPRVRAYLEATKAVARATGKVTTMFGRARWIAGLDASNQQVRGNAERMAINAPVQGTAADLIKLAMIRLHAALAEKGRGASLLLQVHDELILEAEAAAVADTESLTRQVMEGVATLRAPLVANVGAGRSWAEAKG
jgi:DNA polymerase-1